MLEEMLDTLRRGSADPDLDAAGLAAAVAKTQTPDGGFTDRSGEADLYYTAFALKLLKALSGDFSRDAAIQWVNAFGEGNDLDLVHFSCLVRCRVLLNTADETFTAAVMKRLNDTAADSLYELLLETWASDDLNQPPPSDVWPDQILEMQTASGGFANTPSGAATTPTTAAAIMLLDHFEQPIPKEALTFLTEQYHDGAFRAAPIAPVGDLLSTGVALQCLRPFPESLDRGAIRKFVLSCRTDGHLFASLPDEQTGDTEYAFYGLLALGRLQEDAPS